MPLPQLGHALNRSLPVFEYLTKRLLTESLGQRVGQRLRRVRRLLVGFLQL